MNNNQEANNQQTNNQETKSDFLNVINNNLILNNEESKTREYISDDEERDTSANFSTYPQNTIYKKNDATKTQEDTEEEDTEEDRNPEKYKYLFKQEEEKTPFYKRGTIGAYLSNLKNAYIKHTIIKTFNIDILKDKEFKALLPLKKNDVNFLRIITKIIYFNQFEHEQKQILYIILYLYFSDFVSFNAFKILVQGQGSKAIKYANIGAMLNLFRGGNTALHIDINENNEDLKEENKMKLQQKKNLLEHKKNIFENREKSRDEDTAGGCSVCFSEIPAIYPRVSCVCSVVLCVSCFNRVSCCVICREQKTGDFKILNEAPKFEIEEHSEEEKEEEEEQDRIYINFKYNRHPYRSQLINIKNFMNKYIIVFLDRTSETSTPTRRHNNIKINYFNFSVVPSDYLKKNYYNNLHSNIFNHAPQFIRSYLSNTIYSAISEPTFINYIWNNARDAGDGQAIIELLEIEDEDSDTYTQIYNELLNRYEEKNIFIDFTYINKFFTISDDENDKYYLISDTFIYNDKYFNNKIEAEGMEKITI